MRPASPRGVPSAPVDTLAPPRPSSHTRSFAWGFMAQGVSSAVTLGLSLLAGRLLGPQGLGIVYIGFVSYQFALGLQRGVVTQPLIAHAAPLAGALRRDLIASGATIVLVTGLLATALLLSVGVAVGGDGRRALWLFAPWISAALLQEFWKAMLFQEGKGGASALSEVVRLAAIGLMLPLAIAHRSDYVIVGIWGVASALGLLIAVVSLPTRLGPPRPAFRWLRREAWALGRWLGAREIVYQAGSYATVLALAVVIGSSDLGGFRAAEALFSPFSLLAAAFLLPALPALARELATSRRAAQRLAVKIGVAAVAIGAAYFLVMAVFGGWLLTHLFGSAFAPYRGLIWPMATVQLIAGASLGFGLLLLAERRGRVLIAAAVVECVAMVAFASGLGAVSGVVGAAWGYAFARAIGAVLMLGWGVRPAHTAAPR
jgi:O-antigen/teichoic acid export membrane protein